MNSLLSRYAKAIYWMARYMERAENLARILDVNETFSRDSRGGQNWRSVLQLFADEERYRERYDEAKARDVVHFYTLDRENFSSIVSCLHGARGNARTLRPLISTEMWIQLNIFYNQIREIDRAQLTEPRLARFCAKIKEACQAHTGITEGTFYRDEGWYFYELGRKIERADQTTRLLDAKYHLLLPNATEVGSPFDVSQWNAVLRSAAAFHAFRRVHPSGMTPASVSDFLLFNRRFPRSLMACVGDIDGTLTGLRGQYGLRGGASALETLDEVRALLEGETIDGIIERGLHEFLDWIQRRLIAVDRDLGRDFFGGADPDPEAVRDHVAEG